MKKVFCGFVRTAGIAVLLSCAIACSDDVDSDNQNDDSQWSDENTNNSETAEDNNANNSNNGTNSDNRTDQTTVISRPGDTAASADTDSTGTGTDSECRSDIIAVVRDFQSAHPDFEVYAGSAQTTGLVQSTLGADSKPVFAATGEGGPYGNQITSAATFDQWYRDVPGTNVSFGVRIPLTSMGGGMYDFQSNAFFPLDGESASFGNEGNSHNFHFTTEVHLKFIYRAGQTFSFTGDDDLWMFIDGLLAMDLGGLHPQTGGSVNLDTLGLIDGHEYTMDIFHAERHTQESNFRITTSIECITTYIPELE